MTYGVQRGRWRDARGRAKGGCVGGAERPVREGTDQGAPNEGWLTTLKRQRWGRVRRKRCYRRESVARKGGGQKEYVYSAGFAKV